MLKKELISLAQKILALLLAVILPVSVCLWAVAAAAPNDVPVIFIAGFASTPTVDLTSGERVFPPSYDDVKPVLEEYAWTMLRSLVKKDYAKWEEPLVDALYRAFDPIRCDENGDPVIPATTTAYTVPTGDELRAKYDPVRGYSAEDCIYYSFDWRLDLKTLAEDLHGFIEYVLEETGAQKVRLIGSSMGGCVLATYMDLFECEYLEKAIFLSAAFQGASVAGEPMTGRITFDSDNLVAFLSSVMGRDVKGELLNAAADALYQLGAVDAIALQANLIQYTVADAVNERALRYIFGRIPGFWALVPYDLYDEAKQTMTYGIVSDEFYEKIDFYHEIQGRIPAILQEAMDGGRQVCIVSKYGLPSIPAMPSQRNMSDMIVDTHYSSLGAVCADTDGVLPDGTGGSEAYLSADGMIDASACAFPEITWFLKNVTHTAHPDCEWTFLNTLFSCETQPTVETFPAYPRFLVMTTANEIVPLTAETDYSLYAFPTREFGFFAVFKRLMEDYRKIVSALFRLAWESIRAGRAA